HKKYQKKSQKKERRFLMKMRKDAGEIQEGKKKKAEASLCERDILFGHSRLLSWLFWDTASRLLFLLGEDARAANFFFRTCYVLFGTQLGKLPLDESLI
ncbi:hypothetical protein PZH32_13170, partial [Adlercreutzia equolifaciens]|uniref:hypothetical protein n=1 Tax=Adlercreutzia equolifaciens TaxID=446660 RepID=UPI0023B1A9F3